MAIDLETNPSCLSFSTGFHLPTSDIDLVIIGDWIKPPLHELEEELLAAHICSPDKVQVIDKASVPIVKFTHMQTGIKVDISFNIESGLKSIDLIKKFSMTYPPLKKLVIVLKQYLLEKKLNEVFYGGISSYSLILMVISFLQLHSRIDARYANCNLAILLIEFFEFYGCQFNYLKTAISIKGDGTYISKDKAVTDFPPSILCIEDPLTPGNDIGRGCYGVMNVKQAFEQAYITMNQISNPLTNIHYTHTKTILGKIINAMENGILDQRKQLHELYMYSQHPLYAQNNSSDTISSSTSDSDCETQPEYQAYPPLPTPLTLQHQLHQSKENLHVPPRDKPIHLPSTPQLRENTLLQNQQKDNLGLPTNLQQASKENLMLTPNQMQQKENILLPVSKETNHMVQQQKENLQQSQAMQQVHLQHSSQNNKMFHTLPQYRYNSMDGANHRKYNNNKNNDVQYFDDFRIHHQNNNTSNRMKYFPPSNLVDDSVPLTHHHNHYTSMPFIHNHQNQFQSMTFENTSRSNNRQNNKNNNLGSSAASNNYHKKAHSFHST